jgi:Domain of unknown function (DUF4157)
MTRERVAKPIHTVQPQRETKPAQQTSVPQKPGRLPRTLEARATTPAELEARESQQLEIQRTRDLEVQVKAVQRAQLERNSSARVAQTKLYRVGIRGVGFQRAVSEHLQSARVANAARADFVVQRSAEHLEGMVAQRLEKMVRPPLNPVQRQSDLTLSHVADHMEVKAQSQITGNPDALRNLQGFKNAGATLVGQFRAPGSRHTMPDLARSIQRFRDPWQRAAVEASAYTAFGSHPSFPGQLQRALDEQDANLEVQRETWKTELEPVAQRLAEQEASGESAASLIEQARGSGQPLPENVRVMLETKWNTDLSKVRIYTNSSADGISRKLNAKALTTGNDIFFRAGGWNPTSLEGLQLIAHESWHTLQQANGLVQAGVDQSASLETEARGKGAELSSADLNIASSGTPRVRNVASSNTNAPRATRTTSTTRARQPFRATHATARGIQRQRAEETKLKTIAEIGAMGIVFNPGGVNLYVKPNVNGKDKPSGRLAFNSKALVVRELEGGWYQLSVLGGGTGYVNKTFMRVYKEDPGANLHVVKAGQSALGVAEQYYGRFVQPGMDLRYFVNVLAHVNSGALKKPDSGNWKEVAFNQNTVIRVPGIQHALSLRSQINDGSLTNGMYAKVTNSLGHIGDLTKSVLESPQFVGEVLGDLWEVIKPKLGEFIAITTALLVAEMTVAALAAAPEPTMVTKVVAMLLQGAILLFVGYGAAVSLYSAVTEGATWIKTAWNANGKYAQVKLASKAFLRMVGSIALAVLAIMGVRGSLGRFTKLYAKYKAKLPVVQSEPTIASPLKGNPKAIWRGYASLSRIQQQVLEQLPSKGSQTVIPKGAFKLKDLAALTASTGDEFAMFTLAGRRLIMRGTKDGVPINQEMAAALAKKGWRWSAHTHPDGTLMSSPGDRLILKEFGDQKSAVLSSEFKYRLFNKSGDLLNANWLPGE